MIKILPSPITKILLILVGYVSLVSYLWNESFSFRVLFRNVFGNWIHVWFIPPGLLLSLCICFLVLSVTMTKNDRLTQTKLFVLWRNTDSFLLIVFAGWIASSLIMQAYTAAARGGSGATLPFTAAYLIGIAAIAELTARLRDKSFRRHLYWITFFQKHRIWTPLGFTTALLLTTNLLFLIFLSPATAFLFNYRLSFIIGFHFTPPWSFVNFASFLRIVAALTIAGLTYFITYLINIATQYDKANEEKIKSERFKSELITNVSHDIRTPLTSIINYVDLLKSEPLAGKPKEYISILDRKSARLKVLIDDLMSASKASTGNVSVNLDTVNLSELVGQVSGEVEEQFTQRDLTLVLRQPDAPIFVHTDSRHLWRVLENLFVNVSKYALAETRVFAELAQREDDVIFTLKNISQTPIDISGNELTEQFIRGDMARESEGSGLGLYIAKSLVELMNGTLAIRTSGDLFEVEILFRKRGYSKVQ